MTKQEFMAFSLPYGLYLGQHRCMKIEAYLFYGMKQVRYVDKISCYIDDKEHGDYQNSWIEGAYPILHPLSDLTKEIEHNGEKFVPLIRLLENSNFDVKSMELDDIREYEQSFRILELITLNDLPLYLEWHFDLFGGIDIGEAIDVNTLEINPYK